MDKNRKNTLKAVEKNLFLWNEKLIFIIGKSPRHDKAFVVGLIVMLVVSIMFDSVSVFDMPGTFIGAVAGIIIYSVLLKALSKETYIDRVFSLLENYEPLDSEAHKEMLDSIESGDINAGIFYKFLNAEYGHEAKLKATEASKAFLSKARNN